MKQSKHTKTKTQFKTKNHFTFFYIVWCTQKWIGGNKSYSILLWKKKTSFFDINSGCIFLSNTYKKSSGPTTKIHINKYKSLFPRDKHGKVVVKNGIYDVLVWEERDILSWCSEGWRFGWDNNRKLVSGVWLHGNTKFYHWCLQEINTKIFFNCKKYYFIIKITMCKHIFRIKCMCRHIFLSRVKIKSLYDCIIRNIERDVKVIIRNNNSM